MTSNHRRRIEALERDHASTMGPLVIWHDGKGITKADRRRMIEHTRRGGIVHVVQWADEPPKKDPAKAEA